MLRLPRSWQWLKVAITTPTFPSIKPRTTWLFSSITGVYNCWTCPRGSFLLLLVYTTMELSSLHGVTQSLVNPAPPSSDSAAAANPELISIPSNSLLSPSSSPSPQVWTLQKIRFFLPHSHGVAFHGYGVSSLFISSQYIWFHQKTGSYLVVCGI